MDLTVENVARNLTNASVLAYLSRHHGPERVEKMIDKAAKWLECSKNREVFGVIRT